MGVTTQKYRVLVSLGPKLTIFAKTVGLHLWILGENLSFSIPVKNHIWDSYE
jgi:hypothetical protein